MGDYRNPSHNVWALMVKNGRAGEGEYYKPSTGESVPVRSGTRGSLWRTPGDRTYLVGDRMAPSNNAMRVSETTGKGKNKKTTTVGYKYQLLALTDEGEVQGPVNRKKDDEQKVWDPEKGAHRTWLRIHPDGRGWGSEGCLVTPGVAASQGFEKMVTPNGSTITVKYFDTQEQLDAYKKQLDEAYKKKAANNGGPPSETEQGAVLENGDRSVRLGTEQRPTAFANGACVHKGNVPVVQGSDVVRIGPNQLPVSRETDLCQDNQAIKKTQ